MFLILDNYKVSIQEVERVTQAHRDFLDEAYRAGKLLISGPKIPRTGGVIIACVKTRGEVDELIQADPFHQQGIGLSLPGQKPKAGLRCSQLSPVR